MIRASAFDESIFDLRVGWGDDTSSDEEIAEYDLVFLRGGYPCALHPRARLLDVRYDLVATSIECASSERKGALSVEDAAALAARSFPHSRYACDERLRSRAGEVYRRWVRNAADRGDLRLWSGGFVAISRAASVLRVDLIAVDSECRGRGVGGEMIRDFLALPGYRERRVRVECGNVEALRFYLRYGFRIAAVESVQHVWVV